MTRKSKLIAVIVALVAILGIGSTLVFSNSKNGELEELSPQEIKKFMSQDGTGFVVYSFDKEQRDFFTNQVKKVFEKNNVSGKELNSYHPGYDGTKGQSYYGVKQRPDTLAYYQKGELKKEIKFEKYKPSELEKELDVFVRNMKEMYIDK
ncbi:hypothetical protein [Bacillus pseudomycoides]|uniref:hypothetical protein n=1 Tax=Bacillus pseudomycoides TaxID=64104 RepID=UPI000BFA3DAF|nr:hypothetical protein [Bacillus pseudomycoides]PFX44942.1 hypothetical protein COL31_26125 [Bacillus pseudomycoides]PFZ81571.1 hypothetical protein COL69_18335 [Bacillus pseudomycoides]PGD68914.1 hypothetical protein COM46_30270 [Bacillus pseudomycoides]PGE10485.1 hypothetical protein COM51_25745 [Bacillus pseudomycoides]